MAKRMGQRAILKQFLLSEDEVKLRRQDIKKMEQTD